MATKETIVKIKTDLRISHTALDADLSDTIDACLEDLAICGIRDPAETDKTILAAVKLYCRATIQTTRTRRRLIWSAITP